MRLLLTRPTDDSTNLAAKLGEHGVSCLIEPMLEISFQDGVTPDLADVQGILVTSANGIAAFARHSDRRDLAVWAVGPASARAATDLGFEHVHHASGDVAALAALVCKHVDPSRGPLLHVAGTQLAGDLAGLLGDAGYAYRRAVLYEARTARELSAAAQLELREGFVDGVVFFSPRTAETFGRVITLAGLTDACARMTAYCLSPTVADKMPPIDWNHVEIAAQPDENTLVEAILRVVEDA